LNKGYYFILFLIINFGGLALGSWLMDGGPTSDWYHNLIKAPWEPPGKVFAIAWGTIMLCFSWYLVELFHLRASKFLWGLYAIQVFFNVSWNWVFFNQHMTQLGLVVIILLTLVIFYYFITFRNERLKIAKYLLLPYMIWLLIATSLNGYIVFNN